MALWLAFYEVASGLRAACSRSRNYLWLLVILAGMCVRRDLLGVSSVVRSLGLVSPSYASLLHFFHSRAIDVDRLSNVWCGLVLRVFPDIVRFNGRLVLLCDGIKVAKAGRKMPGVKMLHQESNDNTKPEFIMGHSCQSLSLLVGSVGRMCAVPLIARIHEGVVFSNRDRRTLFDKLLSLIDISGVYHAFYLVADAYYACGKMALGLKTRGHYLITRVRDNAVAWTEYFNDGAKRRGPPRKYGEKIKLKDLFNAEMATAKSPVYGETDVMIRYWTRDLLWKPLRGLVRFVGVHHPVRGKCILLSTDLALGPIDIIRLYGYRFKIEVAFKAALHVVGGYAYHFWMRIMNPIKRGSGNQYPHHESKAYRQAIRRKLDAYQRFIQVGCIAQGLLQYLAIKSPATVWSQFGSWLRTIRQDVPPSEMVTGQALRNGLPEFLSQNVGQASEFLAFLRERIDVGRAEGFRLFG